MAELHVTIEDKAGLIKAGVRASRIATLREIAKELNERADVLAALNSAEEPEARAT